jgi:hypothetical protein
MKLGFRLHAEERPRSAKWTNGCEAKSERIHNEHKATERHKKGTGLVEQVEGLGVPACTHMGGPRVLLYCVPKKSRKDMVFGLEC